jgi:hypothetical protein
MEQSVLLSLLFVLGMMCVPILILRPRPYKRTSSFRKTRD